MRWLNHLKWYLWSMLPFLSFGTFSLIHAYLVHTGQTVDGYFGFSDEELESYAPKLFWMGVYFTGTWVVIILINDLFDFVTKLMSKNIYEDDEN